MKTILELCKENTFPFDVLFDTPGNTEVFTITKKDEKENKAHGFVRRFPEINIWLYLDKMNYILAKDYQAKYYAYLLRTKRFTIDGTEKEAFQMIYSTEEINDFNYIYVPLLNL